jgi:hypothetical protein
MIHSLTYAKRILEVKIITRVLIVAHRTTRKLKKLLKPNSAIADSLKRNANVRPVAIVENQFHVTNASALFATSAIFAHAKKNLTLNIIDLAIAKPHVHTRSDLVSTNASNVSVMSFHAMIARKSNARARCRSLTNTTFIKFLFVNSQMKDELWPVIKIRLVELQNLFVQRNLPTEFIRTLSAQLIDPPSYSNILDEAEKAHVFCRKLFFDSIISNLKYTDQQPFVIRLGYLENLITEMRTKIDPFLITGMVFVLCDEAEHICQFIPKASNETTELPSVAPVHVQEYKKVIPSKTLRIENIPRSWTIEKLKKCVPKARSIKFEESENGHKFVVMHFAEVRTAMDAKAELGAEYPDLRVGYRTSKKQ